MRQTDYAGLDYSLGRSNVNRKTGIHYGVISVNSVNLDMWSDADADYGQPRCPKCGNTVLASDDVSLFEGYDDSNDESSLTDADATPAWFTHGDYTCVACKACYWSDAVYGDEPIGYSYEQGGYTLTDCLNNDIFVLDSPYYTYAQFCSPCVPGAGNLDSPRETGPKTYALGHDWFEDGTAPYPLYRVSDDTRVTVETEVADKADEETEVAS